MTEVKERKREADMKRGGLGKKRDFKNEKIIAKGEGSE